MVKIKDNYELLTETKELLRKAMRANIKHDEEMSAKNQELFDNADKDIKQTLSE